MANASSGITGVETPSAANAPSPSPSPRVGRRRAVGLLVAGGLSVAASAGVGWKVADHARSPAVAATRSWHGRVGTIVRSGADRTTEGLVAITPSGRAVLTEGAEVKTGMQLVTDGRTRARLLMDDGSTLALDRATDVTMEATPRTVRVNDGALLAEVAHVEGAPFATIGTPAGSTRILSEGRGAACVRGAPDCLGTKLTVTAAPERTNIEVLRGEADVNGRKVLAGQEGVMTGDGRVDVAPANDLAQRAAFGEQLVATHNEDTDAPASGLGELRARRPGKTDEKDHAVRLASHAVKVRIAGSVARTEIDETFANDTNDELEGIFRFPLPPGAQIERLALEVDGKLVDGEFVDRSKASAIWRGAIQNAAPKAPKPKEEIVWVPGPWHDPALLEWQRGGRFELRIFPIPKRGSRRIVIAYTENVAPVAGVRRYVYPLPQGSSSRITVDQFSVDAQVLGHDDKVPVRARGYELERKNDGAASAVRLGATMSAFVPSGDLAIEYGLDDQATDASAWAYQPPPASSPPSKGPDPVGSDAFVAIALRPKLPRWSETRPRDQVIVVDAGRAMYGERFARAKRLAVQMTQEMDRRDRVTVLACDVGCRTMPGSFVVPGATGAHDVDAFLQGITPDGASDVVGAIRVAAKQPGHEDSRDLRVTLLSDGVATAGYRSPLRVTSQVKDALGEGRALLVAVPIGADADTNLLADVARGGGGVVVPYQPGERLEATALEVLNATYGTALRDVELVLPPGLHDVAPAALAPLRAGSETIVTARLSGGDVKGDVILRGKVGGDAFEARYPIDVRASSEPGNAFVPRLFAAARIADRERTGGDITELVALSQRFGVPSRATSLLVLESEAMFKAFGIDRSDHVVTWTGESTASGSLVASRAARGKAGVALDEDDRFDANDRAEEDKAKKDVASEAQLEQAVGGGSGSLGSLGGGRAMPKPSTTAAPAPSSPPMARKSAPGDGMSRSRRPEMLSDRFEARRGGEFMKRVFVRHATVTADASSGVSTDKVAQARAAALASPDERGKHKDLAKMLALSGQLDELGDTLERWSTRDPLDADVIAARADLAARRGDRDGALRILGGTLAASALAPAEAFSTAQAVARSYDRVGRPEACAFWVAAAEIRSTEPTAIARAMTCERGTGRTSAGWLDGLKDTQRAAVTAALAKTETKPDAVGGDVVVSATWAGGADLDISLVEPSGRRAGAISRLKGARVENALATDRETVSVASSEAGSFVVEIARSDARQTTPQSGSVTIRAFGQTQTIPFALSGARTSIGRVDVRWEAELVPVATFTDDFGVATPVRPFDRTAAASALGVSLAHCASGQGGTGHVSVRFDPSGRVVDAVVDDPLFAGTPTGQCVERTISRVTVPAFSGAAVKVGKSFAFGGP